MRLLSWPVIGIWKLLSLIPLSCHYRIGDFFAWIMFSCRCQPIGEIVRHNIKVAFPYISTEQIRNIEKGYYRRACNFAAEFMHMCKRNNREPVVEFSNINVLYNAFSYSSFVVCYSGHFANYEALIKLPLKADDITMYNFYQPSSCKGIDAYVCDVRSQYGARLVPTDTGVREILKLRGKNDGKKILIGSLAELKHSGHPASAILFGRPYSAYKGTERLGELLGAKFLYAKITSKRRGHYSVEFVPLENAGYGTTRSATTAFFECLEDNVRTQPELWMLWGAQKI